MHHALPARRWAGVLCCASLFTLAPSAPAQILTKTLTYTRFSGPPNNVRQVLFTYNAGLGTTGFSNYTTITTTPGADGVLFAPDSDLIVGGQADAVHKVVIASGLFSTVTAGGILSFHVMLDPSGTIVWTAGIPGFLASVPLQPFANGTAHALNGDDIVVTHLGFAGNKVYYSASLPSGLGNFGTINLGTFTTTRLFTLVPWAHGMTYDCYTDKMIVFANNSVVQIDPATDLIVSSLTVPTPSLQLDQGTSDGVGHLYVASNTGHMLFLDITVSQLVGTPDFADTPFLESGLDDLAPECGLGSLPATPFSQGYWKRHPDTWPLQTLTLGCQTYTKAQCLVLMATPIGGDASLTLVRQLIGAKLNVANNGLNWPLLVPLIDQADTLLCGFAGQLPYGVPSSSAIGQQMTAIAQMLAALTQ